MPRHRAATCGRCGQPRGKRAGLHERLRALVEATVERERAYLERRPGLGGEFLHAVVRRIQDVVDGERRERAMKVRALQLPGELRVLGIRPLDWELVPERRDRSALK